MDEQSCQTSNAHQLRVVRQLLWDVLSQHLYPAERDEIRRTLGGLLLDDNAALFAEASALADILGDVQLDTAALLARQALCSNPQRSMVESEIRLLIDRLHCAAATTPYGSAAVRERDPDTLLPRAGRRDKQVLDYVTTVAQLAETGGRPPSAALPPRPPTALSASAASRPGTSSTRPPTALSASASTSAFTVRPHTALSAPAGGGAAGAASRPSSAASASASSAASSAAMRYTDAPTVVAGVADQLSLASIDAVRDTLRAALEDEKAALLEDVEYLQGLLDMEADMQVRAAAPPPSLAELRDYSARLAAVVAEEEGRVEHEVRVSAMFAAAEEHSNRPGRLRGMVDASRRPPSSPSAAAAAAAAGAGSVAAGSGALRRAGAGGEAGGVGGGAQTLVVHGGEVVHAAPRTRHSHAGSSTEPAAAAAAGRLAAPSVARSAEAAPAAAVARGSALAAVRRPGSGGSGAAATSSEPSPHPPPSGLALRPPAPLPAVRAPAAPSDPALLGSPAAEPRHRTEGSLLLQPSSSGRLRPPSPGRALQQPGTVPSSTSIASPQAPLRPPCGAPGQSPAALVSPLARREPSPARPVGSVAVRSPAAAAGAAPPGVHRTGSSSSNGGSATAAGPQPALRPMPPRSSSATGPSTPERASASAANGPAPASGASPAGPNASPGAVSSSAAKRLTSRPGGTHDSARAGAAVAAASGGSTAAAASPGSAVAARLGTADAAAAAPVPVQPRALLSGRQSVVEVLEAEVDAVRGGVAAILERYNIRPSTPSGGPAAAAAAAAPPPAVRAASGPPRSAA